MMTEKDTLTIHPDILFRKVDDEGVVVDQRQPEVMVVNGLALQILELIRETGSRNALLDRLVVEYDADPATITKDVDEFLEELRRRELIV